MLKHSIIFWAFSAYFSFALYNNNPGPLYPPTKGAVWPKPQYQKSEDNYFTVHPSNIKIKVTGQTCTILQKAVERYSFLVRNTNNLDRYVIRRPTEASHRSWLVMSELENHLQPKQKGVINELDVELTSPCEKYPHFDMDESYNLTISTTSKLISNSIWGILRGLETWSQLFYFTDDYSEVRINVTHIEDFPRFSHRGLLLDTGRHFISLANIMKTLDGMAINKMNVFHWHIVDDQSFPYRSEKFPDLSEKGAFHPSMVYTKEDIALVVEYAKDRGIRVLPEFDVPGHTRSWGEAYPDVLTKCYTNGKVVALGPMDPTSDATYSLLRDLIQEVQEWFPDRYFHVGGDEVQLDCWKSNPDLQKYMKEHNMTVSELHGLFMRNVIPLLGDRSEPIVWQEVFDEGVPLPPNTLIHVWKWHWVEEMIKVLESGYRLIFSASWYLDMLKQGGDWYDFYIADPRHMVSGLNKTLQNNIVGGEACMWGEVVDDTNVISRVWPRASAVAERLWSPEMEGLSTKSHTHKKVVEEVRHRIEEHTCRMRRRAIHAQPPNGAGFCLGAL